MNDVLHGALPGVYPLVPQATISVGEISQRWTGRRSLSQSGTGDLEHGNDRWFVPWPRAPARGRFFGWGALMQVAVAQSVIGWEAATTAVHAAAQHADSLGIRVNIAVVDTGGNLAAFLRMPGAFLHSIDIAIDKAYTAASFGLPTSHWHAALQQESVAVREGIVRRPRFVVFGGGLPIKQADQRIGGIGVSGGSEAQDEACAQAGLAAIGLTL